MADELTAKLGLIKPEVGASDDTWGDKTNENWDTLDSRLGNVDNTSDVSKPIPTSVQNALNLKVTGPASALDGHYAVFDGTTGKLVKDGGAPASGAGNVVGPASAINLNVAVFDGTTGKLIKDGGVKAINRGSLTIVADDYGVVGDNGTIDNTTALQNAVNACIGTGKQLVLPVGVIKITAPINITGPISIRGGGISLGSDWDTSSTGSVIRPSTSINAFNVTTSEPVDLRDFGICYYHANGAAGTRAININPSSSTKYLSNLRIDNVGFHSTDTAIWLDKTNAFTISRCYFWGCVTGIDLRNTLSADTGDSTIVDCVMTMGISAGISGIMYRSGGGLRIINNKLNGGQMGLMLSLDVGAVTGLVIITGNSFENFLNGGVWLQRAGATGTWGQVIITANEFFGGSGSNALRVPTDSNGPWLVQVTFTGNSVTGTTSAGAALVQIDSCSGFSVTGNVFYSNATGTTAVSCGSSALRGAVGPNAYNGPFNADTIVSSTVERIGAVYAAPVDALNGLQINGGMEIAQENGSTTILVANTAKRIVDGFSISANHASGSLYSSQIAGGSLGGYFRNFLMIQANTAFGSPAAGDYGQVFTMIEGIRWARLGFGTASGFPVTISFWVAASVAGTMALSIRNGTVARSFVSDIPLIAGWQYKQVTIPPDTTGTWATDTSNSAYVAWNFTPSATYAGTNNIWQAGNKFSTAATTNFFATAGNYVQMTGVRIDGGNYGPTDLRSALGVRPYAEELQLCRRYLEVWANPDGGYAPFAHGQASSANTADFVTRWLVQKRATPTIRISAAADFTCLRTGYATPLGGISTIGSIYSSPYSAFIRATYTGGPLTVGEQLGLTANNTAAAKLMIDAQL